MNCPKCHKEIDDLAVECPHCHIQVRMFLKKKKQAEQQQAAPPPSAGSGGISPVKILVALVVIALGIYWFIARGAPRAAVEEPAQTETASPSAQDIIGREEDLPTLDAVQPADERPETPLNTEEGLQKIDKVLDRAAPMLPGNVKEQAGRE